MGFIESDGDSGRGGIAVVVEVDKDLFIRHGESVCDGIDDAQVGLMGNDASDVLRLKPGAGDDRFCGIFHASDSMLKDFLAKHGERGEVFIGIFWCDGLSRATAGDVEEMRERAIRAEVHGEDATFSRLGGAQHGGSGAIAEENASAAVIPIDESREFFRADDEGVFDRAAADHFLGDLHGIEKARASGGKVKGDGASGAEIFLHVARCGWREGIGRDGGDNDELDILRQDACLFKGAEAGLGGHVRGKFIRCSDAALLDARACGDPLIRGFDAFFELGIGQDFFRDIAACAGNHHSVVAHGGACNGWGWT